MKVITEERLREKFEESQHKYLKAPLERIYEPNAVMNTLHELIDECQELDTLTVTRLRRMSEAPRDGGYFLACCQPPGFTNGTFFTYKYDEEIEDFVDEDEELMTHEMVKGWIPMPIYEPEKA